MIIKKISNQDKLEDIKIKNNKIMITAYKGCITKKEELTLA